MPETRTRSQRVYQVDIHKPSGTGTVTVEANNKREARHVAAREWCSLLRDVGLPRYLYSVRRAI